MAVGRKKQVDTKKDELFETPIVEDAPIVVKTASPKPIHVIPENIIGALNSAVANVNALFQLRDGLNAEICSLKEELALGCDVKIEHDKLNSLKREQDEFVYEFQIKKNRLEQELKELEDDSRKKLKRDEEEHKTKLAEQVEEQKAQLKAQQDTQNLKLKLDREDHERRIKLEREDWQREQTQFAAEKVGFGSRQKALEEKTATLREELKKELDRDNAHAIEVLKLNHQKETELLKSELKLEQAHRVKFEVLLKETRELNEKLSEQIATLSREALSSASTSSMASKLKDIVTQMAGGASVIKS